MCGMAGVVHVSGHPLPHLPAALRAMNDLQKHRGPDGHGTWAHPRSHVGLAHRRLSIIDLGTGQQPMTDGHGNWITFNGEIYNYIELRQELGAENFKTTSDTEVILRAYRKWGEACVEKFRGMFAFCLWDEAEQKAFCARDRFGIKPLYYTQVGQILYVASEAKALLPFVRKIETDPDALKDYLFFQLCLDGKTLFKNIRELLPGHLLVAGHGQVQVRRYWQVYYEIDLDHTEKYFQEELARIVLDSVDIHTRADVPIGGYISGGLDSSIVAAVATRESGAGFEGFTGKFTFGKGYDESPYARAVADKGRFPLYEVDITAADFVENLPRVLYHLDYPVAGPGSFPQYMVSRLAATRRKVVLGGQGGDEIFGGYARYLACYWIQCQKAAMEGTYRNGNYVVTPESIIPNLLTLREYKPLLHKLLRDRPFDRTLDELYFAAVERAELGDEVNWALLDGYDVYETFQSTFRANNVKKESYFDLMTHFDFKTLLPALLQVEDRVSMAHGLESRVPFLDHRVVEFAATMPADVKFKDGQMKRVLRNALGHHLPDAVRNRKDKMGFPVPMNDWVKAEARPFVWDTLSSKKALAREFIDNKRVLAQLESEPQFGRKLWGLLSLELWQQQFHDREAEFKAAFESGIGSKGAA